MQVVIATNVDTAAAAAGSSGKVPDDWSSLISSMFGEQIMDALAEGMRGGMRDL